MFVPRIGQRLALSFALGLFLLPSISWGDVLIQKPFNTYTSTPASLSVVNFMGINTTLYNASTDATYSADVAGHAPNNTFLGTLDLKNNDLIIHPSAQNETAAYATFKSVYDMLRSGADSGAYDMPGISSSTVSTDAGVTGATNAKGGLAIGVMLNDDGGATHGDGSGNPIWGNPNDPTNPSDLGTFDGYGGTLATDGQKLTQYDTIVKYSFIGDLFLEGRVTQTDASVVFGNLGTNPDNMTALNQRWQNGDEFYSANQPINQTDYAVTFGNLSTQSQYPYTATFAQGGGTAGVAVPEPASLVTAVLGLVGGLALVSRRSRKAH
jgi:hypothetical protein